MNGKGFKIIISVILAVALVAGGVYLLARPTVDNYADKYAGVDLTADVGEISREGTYEGYLLQHKDAQLPADGVTIDVLGFSEATGAEAGADPANLKSSAAVLITNEDSSVTWEVDVPKSGMYYIVFEYCPIKSRGINAERAILINGESPFRGADTQQFTRFWTDDPEDEEKYDNRGNQIRPQQMEILQWATKYASDNNSGYVQEPYRFYFKQGINTLTLEGVSEPLALRALRLEPVTSVISYSDYLAAGPAQGAMAPWSDTIQGEDASLRSDPSLYAVYDRSSPNTTPYSIALTKLNIIGGTSWTINGQWIEWTVDVPEDGWYNIGFKGRQNYARGQKSVRSLQIDGVMPFAEASEIGFQYSSVWQMQSVGDEEGDYLFYLTKGEHTVRLTVALGAMGDTIGRLEDSIYRLNQIYRQLLVVMGRTPDKYRDYSVYKTYPDLPAAFLLESQRLYAIADEIAGFSGGKSNLTGTVTVMANMLEEFSEDEALIKRRLQNFRDNITALGTTMQNLTQSQLDIDYVVVKTPEAQWPKDDAGAFAYVWHEISSFFTSFSADYDSVGNTYDEGMEVIDVWILTGRDQANVLKTIIDDSFTPKTGIGVNLKLVEGGTVLSAVAAGTGPDIILSAGQGEPVNYALRNAAEDLTQFENWEEVYGRFHESAYRPFEFDGGIYAIPETQSFNVLFYRRDIFEELGIDVPQTWKDVQDILTVLQHANMEVGMPDIMRTNGADTSGFYAMMFQNGVELYSEDGKYALLDSEGAIKAFEVYTEFYTNSDIPKNYSFVDRFRSGEMPIGIADFSLQNTLAVFAPELKGLWDFTLIPGTQQADGSIDHSVLSNSACSMMLKSDDQQAKENGWEFLSWWTSAEVQARFGREMECLMGSAARYATANLEAFQQLSWSSEQLDVLNEARQWAQANREVAGGYYTGRHVVNAVRKVINDQTVPRETLLDYNKTINDEIKKKRAEFGLD